ncbi:MAG: hypothetical protein KBS82_05115 [Oscillospiraceae bacterium]|nr:hypothetical protein [Candidatus Limimonas egerieequi]
MSSIFVITTVEDIENDVPYLQYPCNAGWYSSFEAADRVVKNNQADLWETCYNYAIIEEITEGLYGAKREAWFYKYDEDKGEYYPIDRPKGLEHMCSFWT